MRFPFATPLAAEQPLSYDVRFGAALAEIGEHSDALALGVHDLRERAPVATVADQSYSDGRQPPACEAVATVPLSPGSSRINLLGYRR